MSDGLGSRAILKCIGLLFFIFGAAGFSSPKLFGTYLTTERCAFTLGLSVILILVAVYGPYVIIRILSFAFGIFYGGLAVAGFRSGVPGVRAIGLDAVDPLLLRLFEKRIELGKADHMIHLIIAALFLLALVLPRSWEEKQLDAE